jgi:hypothetical protein
VVFVWIQNMSEELSLVEQINEFQIRERALMAEWHLGLPELADARRAFLRKGVHYQWRDGQMWYSPSGLEELKRYVKPRGDIGKEKEAVLQSAIARRLPVGYPLSVDVVAVERLLANPRLVWCRDANGERVTLRARSNKNFRRGMRINLATQCERIYSASSHIVRTYEFLDPLPRYPGRW